MIVQSRADLKTYILNKLGEPVIKVNMADEQLENCIDDALAVYRDYHYDATERVYLPHALTPSILTIAGGITGTFANGEAILGATSNSAGKAYGQANSTTLRASWSAEGMRGPFVVGDHVTGQTSGATGTVTAITFGDIENRYVTVDDAIVSVNKIFSPPSGDTSTNSLFSIQYQLVMNDIYNFISTSMINYVMTKTHLEMVRQILEGSIMVRFQRHTGRLHLDWSWDIDAAVGKFVIIDCYSVLDPDEFTKVWNDWWLRRYATALAHVQWGQNLVKYSGINMPGGTQLNGDKILATGETALAKLEEELQNKFMLPIDFLTA